MIDIKFDTFAELVECILLIVLLIKAEIGNEGVGGGHCMPTEMTAGSQRGVEYDKSSCKDK